MNHLNDESLMERIQEGQLDASALLYQRYKKVLWAYFYNCTRAKEKSEDLVQITFEKMLKYRKNYKGTGAFKSWLFSIARNVLKDEWRKKEKQASTPIEESTYLLADETPSREDQMILAEKKALLYRAMGSLSAEKRELLAMVKLGEKKYKEVAEIYQINEATLKVRVFRIMKELKGLVANIQTSGHY